MMIGLLSDAWIPKELFSGKRRNSIGVNITSRSSPNLTGTSMACSLMLVVLVMYTGCTRVLLYFHLQHDSHSHISRNFETDLDAEEPALDKSQQAFRSKRHSSLSAVTSLLEAHGETKRQLIWPEA
ncbi:hypothetical protein CAPTEDRAFT_197669 [Capitella teleta]|uniref:Uncharacterized protein n=1 Tax=Capitella teleta TaxID=283909 RepID=R7VGQ7_CAPTE|nr:hypothetical protein CAPTEDRAFT_197669 [Capitella teleta]|eukprot:ELU18028.1 hypothetical protein CAPTEDRAFT_197669 [Capitella teleta]